MKKRLGGTSIKTPQSLPVVQFKISNCGLAIRTYLPTGRQATEWHNIS